MPRTTDTTELIATIDPTQLLKRLDEPDLRVIDARPLAAFNGWRLRGEERGGHVPGAGAIPAGWLARLGDAELQALADEHGLDDAAATIVYGYDDIDVRGLVDRLTAIGITGLQTLDGGWSGWTSDGQRPVEALPGYRQLVHPAGYETSWMASALKRHRPDGSCCSTSTSVSRRNTRRATFRARSTSTRTGSRIRRTGTAGRRPTSNEPLRSSASATTRPSSSTAATRRAMPTRSGRVAGPARSRRRAPR